MKQAKQKKINTVPLRTSAPAISVTTEDVVQQKLNFIWPAIIALIGFLLYANTLKHGYVLDDAVAITNNQLVQKGFAGIGELMTVDFWHFSNLALGYYRPLSLITFAIEHQFFGNSPHISHLINVLLYAASGFMLCLLLQELFSKYKIIIPVIICALFIVHPVHTEVVANLKSRDEILSFLGIVSAMFIMLRFDGSTKRYHLITAMVVYYLAFLSKETAITMLVLLPACFYFFRQKSVLDCIIKTAPFVLIMMLFYFQKNQILGSVSQESFYELNNYPYLEAEFPSSMVILLYAIKLLIFPHPLKYDYSYNVIPAAAFSDPLALLGLAVFGLLLFLAVKGVMKRTLWGFSLVVFFATFLPSLAFIWVRGGIFAERFLYAASLGFSIALVYAIAKLLKADIIRSASSTPSDSPEAAADYSLKPVPLVVASCLIVAAFSFKTIDRNPAWKDNITLFSTDIVHSYNSTQNNRHYGHDMLELAIKETDSVKRLQKAEHAMIYLKRAVEINPRFGEVWGDLGRVYTDIKFKPDSAIYFYKRCVQATPGAFRTYSNLGLVYMRVQKYKLASFCFNRALEIKPDFMPARQQTETLKKATGLDVHIYPTEEDDSPMAPQPSDLKMPVYQPKK